MLSQAQIIFFDLRCANIVIFYFFEILFLKKIYGCTTNCIYQKNTTLIEIYYPTVDPEISGVGNVEEENLVQDHNQRFQPLRLEV